jgi:hypothetical protein
MLCVLVCIDLFDAVSIWKNLSFQQFHEWLANKARPKAKSPTHSRPPEDLAERLHTKLVAAEQKRYVP